MESRIQRYEENSASDLEKLSSAKDLVAQERQELANLCYEEFVSLKKNEKLKYVKQWEPGYKNDTSVLALEGCAAFFINSLTGCYPDVSGRPMKITIRNEGTVLRYLQENLKDRHGKLVSHVEEHFLNSWDYHVNWHTDPSNFAVYLINGINHWNGDHSNCKKKKNCPQDGKLVWSTTEDFSLFDCATDIYNVMVACLRQYFNTNRNAWKIHPNELPFVSDFSDPTIAMPIMGGPQFLDASFRIPKFANKFVIPSP